MRFFSAYSHVVTHVPVPMHSPMQDVVIVGLIMKHLKMSMAVMAASATAFVAFLVWLYGGGASIEVLSALQVRGEQSVICLNPGLNHHRRRGYTGAVHSLGAGNNNLSHSTLLGLVPPPLSSSVNLSVVPDCSRRHLPFTRQPVRSATPLLGLPLSPLKSPSVSRLCVPPTHSPVAVEQHPGRHLRHEAAPDLAQH